MGSSPAGRATVSSNLANNRRSMNERPRGTVTFLLTDIEGSTRNWEANPSAMRVALGRHDALLNEGIAARSGVVLTERGEGDSFFAVFDRASDAVEAAAYLQRSLYDEPWPAGLTVAVRMAIHTGDAGGDYRGQDVNRCARLRAVAHGGQVVLSATTEGLVRHHLPSGAALQDLGRHRLRDLAEPDRVFQLNPAGLPHDFPRLRSLNSFRHNLPLQLTSFIGREDEIRGLAQKLLDHRLVTVTGEGGSGKTRLALQVAAEVVERFADGVWLIDLSTVHDPDQLERAAAACLDVKEQPATPLLQTLAEHLADKEMLLLLDNCEHIVGPSSQFVDRVLRAAPALRVMATSREVLNVAGEANWRIPALDVPDPDHPHDIETIERYEAVRLFVDRALAVQASFELSAANASSVVRICQQLDGVPLAIELAAARSKLMLPDEILGRLADRFRLLTGGNRAALPRQQTLRAAVDWSHDLLSEAEQQLFRRLSVFAGTFTLEAVEQVCGWEPITTDDVLDLLSALVDKSLVSVDEGQGSIRYRLHETLRQYGLEKLHDEGEDLSRDRHLDYYTDLAERAYARAGRTEPTQRWLELLELEHSNFRLALERARAVSGTRLVQLCGALSWPWWLRATHLAEGREWLAEALAGDQPRSAQTARALTGASLLASWQGDAANGQRLAGEALSIWDEVGGAFETATALEATGWSQVMAGADLAALGFMERSLELARDSGNERLINRGLLGMSQCLVNLDRVAEVESVAADALVRGRRLGEQRDVHFALHFLADAALAKGAVDEAEPLYRQSLRACLAYGNSLQAGMEVQGLAMALAGQGRLADGIRLNSAAQAWLHAGGMHSESIPFWARYLRRYIEPARTTLDAAASRRTRSRRSAARVRRRYRVRTRRGCVLGERRLCGGGLAVDLGGDLLVDGPCHDLVGLGQRALDLDNGSVLDESDDAGGVGLHYLRQLVGDAVAVDHVAHLADDATDGARRRSLRPGWSAGRAGR